MDVKKLVAERLELVNLYAGHYKFYFCISWNMDEEFLATYDGVKRLIKINAKSLALTDNAFWSVIFHEIGHHLQKLDKKYHRAFTGTQAMRGKYLQRVRRFVEQDAERRGAELMSQEFPVLTYINEVYA